MSSEGATFAIYKPIGQTPLEALQSLNLPDEKQGFVGRLDPMAHGSLLILTGKETKNMDLYKKKNKTYQVKILLGLSTDTTDCLGLTDDSSVKDLSEEALLKTIQSYITTYEQEYHHYSSMTVKDADGKKRPLWVLAKNNQLQGIEIPKKTVTIYNIDNLGFETVSSSTVKETLIKNVSSLKSGNFRQMEITQQWENYPYQPSYKILTLKIFVSSGTYIRQLVKDFSKDLNYPLMVYDLHRLSFS